MIDKRTPTERDFGPLRKIRGLTMGQSKYARPGHGTAELRLSCGHVKYVKNSKVPDYRTRCRECRTYLPDAVPRAHP